VLRSLFLLNVAALSPSEIGLETPNLSALKSSGGLRPLIAPQPALTCTSHATMITGLSPREHGVVGNGWYEASHKKIFNWGRSDGLVSGEKLWEAAQRRDSSFKTANLFWRFCTHADCDLTLTERPTYFANGRKGADIYSSSDSFRRETIERFGPFPFFHFWGPKAELASSEWILKVTEHLLDQRRHRLIMCYAPGLDYDGQRFGPRSTQARSTLSRGDALIGETIERARSAGYDVAIVSDYGFTEVTRPIFLNRVLRQSGYVEVDHAANGELLEPGASRAFAVCDNQAAHIYVRDEKDIEAVKTLLIETEGVRSVLGPDVDESPCLGHSRSGTLLAIADPDAWFAYPYWLEEEHAPDFASCVDIFNKPGFDPCEMLLREGVGGGLHLAKRFLQMKLGIRAPFDVISTRYDRIRGVRNIAPRRPEEGATLISSWALESDAPLPMHALKELLLKRLFED
jgi:predicted AlkP superfamily pyrophosphatase or phosphodiesterase